MLVLSGGKGGNERLSGDHLLLLVAELLVRDQPSRDPAHLVILGRCIWGSVAVLILLGLLVSSRYFTPFLEG